MASSSATPLSAEASVLSRLMDQDPIGAAEELIVRRDEYKSVFNAAYDAKAIIVAATVWNLELSKGLMEELADIWDSMDKYASRDTFKAFPRILWRKKGADHLLHAIERARRIGATFPEPEPEWMKMAREEGENMRKALKERRKSKSETISKAQMRKLVARIQKMRQENRE